MLHREALLYIDTPYRPDSGQFCRAKGVRNGRYEAGIWHRCRETWHAELRTADLFFYSHDTGKSKSVISFMQKIEQELCISQISHFGPTQRKTICWIEPSGWWVNHAMRRSLFTILLRASQNYKVDEDNFDQALYSNNYTNETRYAVERFFAGFTTYTGRKRGWYNQFNILNPSKEEIDKLLIRRDR